MLWVAMLAYRDAAVEVSREGTLEQRRRLLFANFVDAMYKRRSLETRYTQQHSVDWLSWLASRLTQNKQTVFYLENLRPDWLPTRTQRWLCGAAVTVASGLIAGLIVGLIFGLSEDPIGGLLYGLVAGLIFGLLGGLFGGLSGGTSVRVYFRLEAAPSGVPTGVIPRLILGPSTVPSDVLAGMILALILGLIAWLTGGLIGGLITLLTTDAVESRRTPNQGTHFALRLVLWMTRSAPLNYIRFLDFAAERFFLRKVGGGYILVHRMLLEYFAALAEPHKVQDRENETSGILS
jgi:hypothetical protein